MERMFYVPMSGPVTPPPYLQGVESVMFASADGTRLHGWFIPAAPGASNGQRSPTVLHVHGNAGNIESHIDFTEHLPAAGYNLFIFDYRGYGQSEGIAWRRAALIADTEAALDALLKRSDVDPQRIGMYGHSLGGSIALNVMARRPEIRVAVIESAFTSWRDIAASVLGGASPNVACRWLASALIGDANRADHAIAQIDRPILLIHGSEDSIVPVEHSRRLAKASGGRAQLIEIEGGDHNTLQDTHPEVRTMVSEFFAAHLHEPADAAPKR